MPGDGHWKPGGHHVHCELFTFAACPENVPGGHSTGCCDPVGQKCPGGQVSPATTTEPTALALESRVEFAASPARRAAAGAPATSARSVLVRLDG